MTSSPGFIVDKIALKIIDFPPGAAEILPLS